VRGVRAAAQGSSGCVPLAHGSRRPGMREVRVPEGFVPDVQADAIWGDMISLPRGKRPRDARAFFCLLIRAAERQQKMTREIRDGIIPVKYGECMAVVGSVLTEKGWLN